jgi:hypothetical protein
MNPGNNFENGFFSDPVSAQLIATDITIAADDNMDLETVNINVWLQPGDSVLDANFVFTSDLGGFPNPGDVIDSQLGVAPTSEVFLGSNFGWDIYDVTFDLPAPTTLPGQSGVPTTYWVSILMNTSNVGQAAWGATTASSVGNDSRWSTDGGATWMENLGWDQVYTFAGTCTGGGGGGGGDEWTVHVFDLSGNFGDEVSWELRDNGANVILSGGPYNPGYDDTQMVNTENEPLEFYIEAMGTFNDNTPSYEVFCSGNLIASGSLSGGDEATESGLVCPGATRLSRVVAGGRAGRRPRVQPCAEHAASDPG